MKIQLHNKFEITIRNKTYTAYNTLLKSVYDKIYNLEQFTSHIAIGTGLENLTFTDTKLKSYLRTLTAETEEVQCDVSKGTLYIKKVASLEESDQSVFSFSELGLTATSDFDPIIYNHVLLTDSEGNPVSITRNQGDAMQIRVTIYLELTPETSAMFVSGDNLLIKQMLGDDLQLDDHNLYVIRGENLIENKQIVRTTPDLTNQVACEKMITYNNDNSVDILFSAELGEGDLEEVLVCFGGRVCMRLNTLELNAPTSQTLSITPTQGIIEVDKNVKEITSLAKVLEDGEETIADYNLIKYSKKLTDKIENVFDQSFTSATQKFIAKDGKRIAFVQNSYIHMYTYGDYGFTKVNTIHMPTSDILKMFLFEDLAVVLLTVSPYIRIFKIEGNVAIEQGVSLDLYDNSSYSYNWLDAEATLTANGKIKIGIIIDDESFTPIVVTLTKSTTNGVYYDTLERPKLTTAKKVYSIYKNSFSESLIGFLTDTYNGQSYYFQEEFYEDTSSLRDSSEAQYLLLADTLGIQTGGRAIISQKGSSPYLYVFYYPEFNQAPSDISTGTEHYFSYNGDYIIAKYQDETYKIFNFHTPEQMIEFENGFPSYVDFSEIADFAFVGDLLLVFTSTGCYGICVKNAYTRIDNLTDQTSTYLITYLKYDLLGSRKLEGVKIDLSLSFNKT